MLLVKYTMIFLHNLKAKTYLFYKVGNLGDFFKMTQFLTPKYVGKKVQVKNAKYAPELKR